MWERYHVHKGAKVFMAVTLLVLVSDFKVRAVRTAFKE